MFYIWRYMLMVWIRALQIRVIGMGLRIIPKQFFLLLSTEKARNLLLFVRDFSYGYQN